MLARVASIGVHLLAYLHQRYHLDRLLKEGSDIYGEARVPVTLCDCGRGSAVVVSGALQGERCCFGGLVLALLFVSAASHWRCCFGGNII